MTKVLLDVRYRRRAVVESALTVEANGSAAAAATNNESGEAKEARGGRGLVLDGDETVVSLLALSVDGCDTHVPDIEYILSPGVVDVRHEGVAPVHG